MDILADAATQAVGTQPESQPESENVVDQAPPTTAVTVKRWITSIQELAKPTQGKTGTMAQQCPRIWALANVFLKEWLTLGFEVPLSYKNKTDFKSKVVKHILFCRKLIEKADFPCVELVGAFPNEERLFWCPLEDFLLHAVTRWKTDEKRLEREKEDCVNDVIRLYGIAALQDNRDDLPSVGKGKNTVRLENDGPSKRVDSIFYAWALQFNDPQSQLHSPERAVHLSTHHLLDPNDPTRIEIKRDHVWLKNLHFKTLTECDEAAVMWTAGTGGGDGAPENHTEWKKRDDELFANCSKVGKGDCSAWIYMLDKQTDHAFNHINQPPPEGTTMEDGVETNSSNKRKRHPARQDTAEKFASSFGTAIEKGFSSLAEIFKPTSDGNNPTSSLDLLDQTLEVIEKLEDRKDKLLKGTMQLDEAASTRRLNFINNALEKAHAKLQNIN